MTKTDTPFRAIALGTVLTCLAGSAAFANSSNAYLNGTYVLVNFDPTPESDLISITFDGAGDYTGTDTNNDAGTISTSSISGTYTVASNGALSGLDLGGNSYTGQLSADGNTFVITNLTSSQMPAILVGVKQSLASGLNVASGLSALAAVTTGVTNTAAGASALTSDTTGSNNTAFGANALYSNISGKGNAAQGVNALYYNSSGIRNLGIGSNALYDNTTGSYNIALGFDAGYNVTTGSNNIEIGASGTASDNNTIQIGVQGTQAFTTIAGIYGTPVTGSAVYVTSTGQLGVQASSERYKTDIAPMPDLSEKLSQLRPVTFHYKTDPNGVRQYGLIAEEVDKVSPELVIRDETGKIQGVHYEELAPMLLSEVQRQQGALQEQHAMIKTLSAQNALQATEIRELKHQQREQLAAQARQLQNVQRQLTDLLVKQRQYSEELVSQR